MSDNVHVDTSAVLDLAEQLKSAARSLGVLGLVPAVSATETGLPGSRTGTALREAARRIDTLLETVPVRLQVLASTAIESAARYAETETRTIDSLRAIGGL